MVTVHKSAVEWGGINAQGRLAIPASITDCLSWYDPAEDRIEVLIDLSQPRLITIRNWNQVASPLAIERESLLQENENAEVGQRRIAMTYHYFRRATLTVAARRLGLKEAILDHLETKTGGRLFCVGFADRVEAYNEAAAREIIAKYADDIKL